MGVAIPGAPALVTVMVAAGAAALAGPRHPAACLVALAVALFAAGAAWGGARMAATAPAAASPGDFAGVVRIDAPARLGRPGRGPWVTARTAESAAAGAIVPAGARLIVDLPAGARVPRSGSALRVRGRLAPAASAGAPGWWRRWVVREGISGRLRAEEARPAPEVSGDARARWRGWAQTRVAERVGGERGAVVRGLALGGGAGIGATTAREFRDAGIWHLLAVSGQNVTAVALATMAVLGAIGAPRRAALVVAMLAVVAYVLACDGGPSVGRAAVVGLLVLGTQFAGRARSPWHALVIALVALLAHQPRALFDPGLHLSFAAVGGLFALSPGIDRVARGWLPRPAAVLLGASLGAGIATAPVLAAHFGRLSLAGVAVNVVAVPLAAPVVVLALTGLVLDALAAGVGRPFLAGAAAGAEALMLLAQAGSAAPHAAVDVPAWSAVPLAGGALGVLVALRAGKGAALARGGGLAAAAWLLAALLAPPGPAWPSGPEVAVLDVGQGQAVLLRDARGTAVLIDAGPPGTPAPAAAALRRHGVRRLDLLVLTHGARDQAGGAGEVIARVRPRRATHGPFADGPGEADGLAALRLLRVAGVPLAATRAGDMFRIGAWSLEVLSPVATGTAAPANDRSVVLMVRAPGLTALIASDAEGDVLLRTPLPRAGLLVVGHHGSEDPRLAGVLARVRPAIAAISAGRGNRHGHPAPATLRALTLAGVRVRRTDREGELRLGPEDLVRRS